MSRTTHTARAAVREAINSQPVTKTMRAFVVGNYTADTGSMMVQFNDPRTGMRGATTRARVRPGLLSSAIGAGTPVVVSLQHGRAEVISLVLDSNAALLTGAWTPELTFETPGSMTWVHEPTYYYGVWYRMGPLVYVSCNAYGTLNKGTASGYLRITGLPFAAKDNIAYYAYMTGQVDSTAWTHAGISNYAALLQGGYSEAWFYYTGSGGVSGYFDAADFASGDQSVGIYFTGWYEIET